MIGLFDLILTLIFDLFCCLCGNNSVTSIILLWIIANSWRFLRSCSVLSARILCESAAAIAKSFPSTCHCFIQWGTLASFWGTSIMFTSSSGTWYVGCICVNPHACPFQEASKVCAKEENYLGSNKRVTLWKIADRIPHLIPWDPPHFRVRPHHGNNKIYRTRLQRRANAVIACR